MKPMNLHELANQIKNHSVLFADDECPFSVHLQAGDSTSRMLVVAGENAEGKSMLVRYLAAWAKKDEDMSPLTISIRERTGSGLHEMASFRRAMMFGEEHQQSTGETSFSTTRNAFSNVAARAKDGKAPLLILDEPDMGLSEGYAHAFGTWLARQAQAMPAEAALILVSHSRALVRAFRDESIAISHEIPHFAYMGAQAMSFNDWLDKPVHHSVEDLMGLRDLAMERFRTAERLMNPSNPRPKTKKPAARAR